LAIPILDLWVIAAPGTDIFPLAPSGAVVAEDFLTQARLKDKVTAQQEVAYAVRRALAYLHHRFPGRLRVRWVNPWSLYGLWFCWRHKVRRIPSLLLPDGRQFALAHLNLPALRDFIAAYLAGESPNLSQE